MRNANRCSFLKEINCSRNLALFNSITLSIDKTVTTAGEPAFLNVLILVNSKEWWLWLTLLNITFAWVLCR